MTDNHPITPPPELWQQWYVNSPEDELGVAEHIATQAARWGADQELEACEKWVNDCVPCGYGPPGEELRAARRPKPPSLKEQALEQLRFLQQCGAGHRDTDKILRALEQLDD